MPKPWHPFNAPAFVELNRHKCEEVRVLDLGALTLSAGLKEGVWHSPFSAPFGGFDCEKQSLSVEQIDESLQKLSDLNLNVKITLPPPLYGEDLVAKYASAMLRHGFAVAYADLSYHFDLRQPLKLRHNARNQYHQALRSHLRLKRTEEPREMETAYQLIAQNRVERGYGPHMPWNEILRTSQLIPMDVFLVEREADSSPCAAAIVFRLSEKIALPVVWGDSREKAAFRPMNFLAVQMAEHYQGLGFETLDLGPASKEGVPNLGLCHFKEGLGCQCSLKFSFINF